MSEISKIIVGLVKDIVNAELNRQLPRATAKHKEVLFSTLRRIDAAKITDATRKELTEGISESINGIVDIMNDKGMFVSGGEC